MEQFESGTGVPPVKTRARCACHIKLYHYQAARPRNTEAQPQRTNPSLRKAMAFRNVLRRSREASKTKNAADPLPNQPRFVLHPCSFRFSVGPLIGLRLLISPGRLPLASPSRSSAASPFCSLTAIGNSVPPKEPPLLRCKAPPPKRLATPA